MAWGQTDRPGRVKRLGRSRFIGYTAGPMNILLTNDDGFDAEGLAALRDVAGARGRVTTVAPTVQHSMKSHAITTGTPLELERDGGVEDAWRCSGTPADCVRIGLRHLPLGPVELVLSGINHGANLGVDVFYSGTVAAAREAALLGVPAIAVSQLSRNDRAIDWQQARRLASEALDELGARVGADPSKLPPLTSINLPDPLDGRVRGVRFCPLTLAPMPARFDPPHVDGRQRASARYAVSYFERPAPEGSDVEAAFNGWVTITTLTVDGTPWEPPC